MAHINPILGLPFLMSAALGLSGRKITVLAFRTLLSAKKALLEILRFDNVSNVLQIE